ncbi:hypothetical protein B0920_09080 [Massilia sp. KIM]|nr:hypothetical protein B0920_09080 [Massilia sp. KIM]
MMSNSKSTGNQNEQSAKSEEQLAKERAGVKDKSSHDHMSRERAKTDAGAGGGAKQKQNH